MRVHFNMTNFVIRWTFIDYETNKPCEFKRSSVMPKTLEDCTEEYKNRWIVGDLPGYWKEVLVPYWYDI